MNQPVQEQSQAMPQRLTYTLPETARLLGISERFLRELIYQEYVPVLRLGRRVLVRRATVERLAREPEGAEAPLTVLLAERAERRQRERNEHGTARQA